MRNKKFKHYSGFIFFLLGVALLFGFVEGDKNGKAPNKKSYTLQKIEASGKQGDAYRMNVNNLNIPLNRVGTIADVNIPPDGTLGRFGNSSFLFSSGFFMSGYSNNNLWAFGQASASLVENMVAGTPSRSGDPNAVVYVLNREDEPFSQSWIDWIDAVDLGADFYDGNGDGVYDPVDLNGNGEWDPMSAPGANDGEDRPDILGDETAWCVYWDGQPGAQRSRYAGVNPQGIVIRQTVFAFASKGALGNIMFIRYRITNTGLVSSELDSVIFGVWADPDLGASHEDDLVGVDVPRNSGFTYQNVPDPGGYGSQPPAFMIDFFSGPASYIPGETFIDNNGDGVYTDGTDTPLDTAYSYRGQVMGIETFPGAKNLDISSFVHYIQSDPQRGDPNDEFEARNYMEGRLKLGEIFDPCGPDAWGEVRNVDCTTLDPKFWYSGDPVTNVGWLTTVGTDQRQMTNVGPFTLRQDEEIEIVVAYVVGQGSSPLNSITVARAIDDGAQFIFDGNFRAPVPPPTLKPVVESGETFIDFVIDVSEQVSFTDQTQAWDNRFEGINIYAYRTNSTQEEINGVQNEILFRSYQLDNFINSIYKENAETGGIELLYPETDSVYKLDPQIYSDPETGRIRVRVTQDPFTGGPLVKGKPYYFALTSYALNYDALVNKDDPGNFGAEGDYYLSTAGFVQEVENVPKIITVVLGEDLYSPPIAVVPANKVSGPSLGRVGYDVVKQDELTNSSYEVTFFKDSSSTMYKMFWQLQNTSTGEILVDSGDTYEYDNISFVANKVTEGFITKVEEQTATVGTPTYMPSSAIWYSPFDSADGSGVYYVGDDLPMGSHVEGFRDKRSTVIAADDLRRVELRFDTQGVGKAYRYLNGYVGIPKTNSYRYAAAITSSDTVNSGAVGNWDTALDRANGFVDVPFTAWVVDSLYGEEYQLAVGFVERRRTNAYPTGNPDGVWDPSDSLRASGEVIVIFNAPYDPTGSQIEYTGGEFTTSTGTEVVWADLLKIQNNLPPIPADAVGITEEQRRIFSSPWFNAMWVVGFERDTPSSFFTPGDKLVIPLAVYPYTESSVYQFSTSPETLTEDQKRELFQKVNVFPNPLYGFNIATSYTNSASDEPFVTFSNLPEEVTIKVYSLSGQLLRTLGTADKSSPTSPFLRWDLQNESGLRVSSGMYLAIVTSPKYGEKVLKFAIIMPQKQIQKF